MATGVRHQLKSHNFSGQSEHLRQKKTHVKMSKHYKKKFSVTRFSLRQEWSITDQ